MMLHKHIPVLAPKLLPHHHWVQIQARKEEGDAKDITTVTSLQDPLGQLRDGRLHPGGMNCPGSLGQTEEHPGHSLPEAVGASAVPAAQEVSISSPCCSKQHLREGGGTA